MLSFHQGNLFDAKVAAYVNTTNCVGVMGKGIALEFKKRYPAMFADYVECCKAGKLRPGKMHLWRDGDILIVNFPTKTDWRLPSKISWIEAGLARLFARVIPDNQIVAIGIPALGCNNGGLQWSDVKQVIQKWYNIFDDVLEKVDVRVYEPMEGR